jgi:hypothetical protein
LGNCDAGYLRASGSHRFYAARIGSQGSIQGLQFDLKKLFAPQRQNLPT